MTFPSVFGLGKHEISSYNTIVNSSSSKKLAFAANKTPSKTFKKTALSKNNNKWSSPKHKKKRTDSIKRINTNSFNNTTAIIAILATKFWNNRSFGVQDIYFRQLINNIYQSGSIGYVFTAQNIDWRNQLVYGYYLESAGINWLGRWFPMPDVCYNRSFHDASSISIKDLAKLMQKKGIKIFNTSIGDKLQVYKKLASHPDVAAFQPDTQLLTSGARLKTMLNEYREVYIKPINGTNGRGIFKISLRNNQYYLQSSGSNKAIFCNDIAQILSMIYNKRTVKMLLQAGIRNPGLGGHFDLRVLVQKDARNHWHITGKAARLGLEGSVTTNLHTGGAVREWEQILRERGLSTDEINYINDTVIWLVLKIAEILDRSSVAIGELGLDFIIDEYGKVWFIEANRKPGRQSLDIMGEEAKNTALMRPIEYALYLSGKPYFFESNAPEALPCSAPD
jgi:glutathione synthase/RimK-type ligase-like ATP-grasp enzyme